MSMKVSSHIHQNGLLHMEASDYLLKCFTNAVSVDEGMAPADFTEAAGGGYVDIRIKGNTSAAAAQIEGLTRAAACVVTWTSHPLRTGDKVTFADIAQQDWTALNGEHVVTYVSGNSFSIAVNTSAYAGDYVPATDAGTIVETTPNAWTEELANDPIDIILAQQSIVLTGPLNGAASIIGYYFQKQGASEVDAYETIPAPYTPGAAGGTLTFTPRIQAGNGEPT